MQGMTAQRIGLCSPRLSPNQAHRGVGLKTNPRQACTGSFLSGKNRRAFAKDTSILRTAQVDDAVLEEVKQGERQLTVAEAQPQPSSSTPNVQPPSAYNSASSASSGPATRPPTGPEGPRSKPAFRGQATSRTKLIVREGLKQNKYASLQTGDIVLGTVSWVCTGAKGSPGYQVMFHIEETKIDA